jgi:hypothetical protein
LLADYLASGARASPRSLKGRLPKREAPLLTGTKGLTQRQIQHLSAQQAAAQPS